MGDSIDRHRLAYAFRELRQYLEQLSDQCKEAAWIDTRRAANDLHWCADELDRLRTQLDGPKCESWDELRDELAWRLYDVRRGLDRIEMDCGESEELAEAQYVRQRADRLLWEVDFLMEA